MPEQSKLALLPPWGSAVAGATGAVLANAIVYPLDIVKTRLQVQVKRKPTDPEPLTIGDEHYTSTYDALSKIFRDDGLTGLYAGINGSLIGVASTNFAYFYWYSVVRTVYISAQKLPKPPNTAIELSLGALAGALAQVFTIPVSVVTTRQQTQPKGDRKGLVDTGREVVNSEDGYSGLWRGLKASLVLVVNPAITYGAYSRLKEVVFPGKTNLKPWEAFREYSVPILSIPIPSLNANDSSLTFPIILIVLGAMSKALATLATQPLIVAKVGLQSRPPPARNGVPFKSFVEVMEYIVKNEGPLGLFKGIGPQILKGLFVQGLLMMTKERMELLFILLFRYVRQLRSQELQQVADVAASKAKHAMPVIAK
ncbi:MAG: ADP/ATP carrier protein [Sclerophora amabilis]|nr:MAG: ADP/ATP carrier protein [Sclerophora amabilis]